MQWSWSWIPYGGQASFGDNPFFDWVRVACVVAGIILALAMARVVVEGQRRAVKMPCTQVARFIALGLADVSISFTEIAVVGTPATPRLLVNVLALVVGIYGVRGERVKQRATPPIR